MNKMIQIKLLKIDPVGIIGHRLIIIAILKNLRCNSFLLKKSITL